MTPQQIQAAIALAEILDAENAVLEQRDYGAIVLFSDRKRQALEDLDRATGEAVKATTTKEQAPHPAALRLDAAVTRNREMLTRAIKVQNRMMGVIASAARTAQVPAGYGAGGTRRQPAGTQAVALVVRA